MHIDKPLKQVIIRNTKLLHLPEVVKLVDAVDSKSTVSDDVSVRVRPSGPYIMESLQAYLDLRAFLLSEISAIKN